MLYALDTEFLEDGTTIDLLSLGLVGEDSRTFYAQNLDCDLAKANPWVVTHVLPHLVECVTGTPTWHRATALQSSIMFCGRITCPWLFHHQFGKAIEGFLASDAAPRFLTYYGAYDWVAFCQCFGAMADLPSHFPKYALDLRAWLETCGHPDITQPDTMPHNALAEAQWIMTIWQQTHGVWRAGVAS